MPYSVAKPFVAVCVLRPGAVRRCSRGQRPRNAAMAGLYVALADGRVLSLATLADMVAVHADGLDRVVGARCQWGLGVGVEPEDGWGMGGVGGSFGWWSHAGPYAVGFVTGLVADHDRGTDLENAVRAVLDLPPV
jgi:hypothetical protein